MSTTSKDVTVYTTTDKEVTVELVVEWDYESNYGADADGNRGVGVWFVDGISAIVPTLDDAGNLLTVDERKEVEYKAFELAETINWERGE